MDPAGPTPLASIRGSTMFDGTVILKEENGTILGKCTTTTVKPITERQRQRLPFFVSVDTDAERKEWESKYPGIPAVLGDESVQLLRSREWQERYGQYYSVDCETPVL